MNTFTKILLILAILATLLQITIGGITGVFLGSTILYLYFFIILMSTGAAINAIRKDFGAHYLRVHYKNPALAILMIILISIGFFLLAKGGASAPSFALWVYFLFSFIYCFESRLPAFLSLFFLGVAAVMLLMNRQEVAEELAVYVFWLLVITVLTQIRETCLKNPDPAHE